MTATTGSRVLTPFGAGLVIGWRGLWTAIVALDSGRTVEVDERELRKP